ncbi:hypothetical protein HUT18_12730 [Streptomyces sp. NA04227]|uniref:hypothetical protein n=1 Tax=Streptomyces sp. NA04227 TaxID=2742136 RepID=UPI00159057D4|nr:hypothetical protein [Streptomyces sp. NA04227]QKW07136.1 hypothetical protein HUT18_12730 [Streptomyces sp. NA04227]
MRIRHALAVGAAALIVSTGAGTALATAPDGPPDTAKSAPTLASCAPQDYENHCKAYVPH